MPNLITPDQLQPTLVAGIGCQRGCSARTLFELIEPTLERHGLQLQDLSALASIDIKSNEPGLLELARQLGLPLIFFSSAQLAPFESQLTHRSPLAFQHTKCHGVAESAALALASRSGPATLLIPRLKSQQATFALASALAQGR
ncbi:cobalamin biosynthesis protein [Pseudomonas sp. DWP3-1-2]|jgi:cobalt-precorrin 5A hydrolase|uniref:cobalamin biosynthesis protein n=1 Tax=Pseudomonas sp. DWP3-1-2 TaxID=2804645 RepID=UPI003CEAE5F6